jgi:hypothetical protein
MGRAYSCLTVSGHVVFIILILREQSKLYPLSHSYAATTTYQSPFVSGHVVFIIFILREQNKLYPLSHSYAATTTYHIPISLPTFLS